MPRDSQEDFSPFSVTAADFLNSSLSALIDTGWQGPKDTISPLFLLTHQHSFQVSRLPPLYSAILLIISFCLLPRTPLQFFSSPLSPSPSELFPVELSVPTMTHLLQWQLHSFCPHPSPATQRPWISDFVIAHQAPPFIPCILHSFFTQELLLQSAPSTQSPMGCVINSSSMSLFLPLLHLSAPLDEFSEEGIRIPSLDLHSSAPWSPCKEYLHYALSPSFPNFSFVFLQDSIYHTGYILNMSMHIWQSLFFPVLCDADGSFFFALLSL